MRDGADLVGKRIREQRERIGIGQKEFAESLGTTSSNMHFYEKGSRSPSYELLVKIARRLGVTTDFLLGARETTGAFSDEKITSAFEEFCELTPRDRKVVIEMIRALKKVEDETVTGHQ